MWALLWAYVEAALRGLGSMRALEEGDAAAGAKVRFAPEAGASATAVVVARAVSWPADAGEGAAPERVENPEIVKGQEIKLEIGPEAAPIGPEVAGAPSPAAVKPPPTSNAAEDKAPRAAQALKASAPAFEPSIPTDGNDVYDGTPGAAGSTKRESAMKPESAVKRDAAAKRKSFSKVRQKLSNAMLGSRGAGRDGSRDAADS
ncbi:hypothetical protein M885DRAFT_131983 [Pelagophyceae sp. CCMP2097]|nr:hypothetical protein M885DRAFT_131983 [Pelagophyceae sp. CCMP2097]